MDSQYIPCTYCDEPAEVKDHFLPVASRPGSGRRYARDTVPACSNCNVLKGCKRFEDVAQVQDYIAHRLRIKHRKLLAAPTWVTEELAELGLGRLKQDILSRQRKKVYVLRRLDYLENQQKCWIHLDDENRLVA